MIDFVCLFLLFSELSWPRESQACFALNVSRSSPDHGGLGWTWEIGLLVLNIYLSFIVNTTAQYISILCVLMPNWHIFHNMWVGCDHLSWQRPTTPFWALFIFSLNPVISVLPLYWFYFHFRFILLIWS